MSKKAHQAQFPETPWVLTISVTKLGVSAEKVVATIEIPNNHQGIFRPDKKKSLTLCPAERAAHIPIARETMKKAAIMAQSKLESSISNWFSFLNIA